MGKCIKCGKETEHIYEYYSGEYVGRQNLMADKPGVKYIVQHTYKNITHNFDFFCVRCSRFRFSLPYGLWAVISLVISLPILIIVFIQGSKDEAIVIFIGLFICGIVFLFIVLYNYYAVARNKPLKENIGSKILVAYLKKRIKNKTLFTIEERYELK